MSFQNHFTFGGLTDLELQTMEGCAGGGRVLGLLILTELCNEFVKSEQGPLEVFISFCEKLFLCIRTPDL